MTTTIRPVPHVRVDRRGYAWVGNVSIGWVERVPDAGTWGAWDVDLRLVAECRSKRDACVALAEHNRGVMLPW